MYNFHRRNNKKEVMVGWYSTTSTTGEFINDNSSLIHDVFSKEIANPIHLVVDTTLLTDQIAIRGFIGRPTVVGGEVLANSFHEIKVEIDFNDYESTLLYHMIQGQAAESASERLTSISSENKWKEPAVVSSIPSHAETVSQAAVKLEMILEKIQRFVDSIVEGKVPESHREIGIALTDILNNYVGNSFSASDVSLLNSRFEDLLMVSYLSTLTETQTVIAEKLNQIL